MNESTELWAVVALCGGKVLFVNNTREAAEREQPCIKTPSAIVRMVPDTPPAQATAADWAEDFPHENGNYENRCSDCGICFMGHKRRTICKVCAERNTAAPTDLGAAMRQIDDTLLYCKNKHAHVNGTRAKLVAARAVVASIIASQPSAIPQAASLSVKLTEMHESNGNVTWSVLLAKSPEEQPWDCHTVYTDTIKGRAEYEADSLKHFLGLGPEPDMLEYDTDVPAAVPQAVAVPEDAAPEWIVNDLGELGVRIGARFYFLYKGDNISYETGLHDDGTPMLWRPVGKREFGETCWPLAWVIAGKRESRYTQELAYYPGLSFGKPEDANWRPMPAIPTTPSGEA